ncbi:MAG: hypothetical protein Q3971_07685 [Moraxella sp.]|nr:hypothetical protein [Moraxella sp.]
MNAISVYYENWQMDCCGESFKIGDTVQWDCVKSNDDFLIQADYYYEAHDDSDVVIMGKVAEIYGIECQYEKRENGVLYPIGYHKTPISQAKEFMSDKMAESGFLVVLDDVVIK